jgi:hypothetical protein
MMMMMMLACSLLAASTTTVFNAISCLLQQRWSRTVSPSSELLISTLSLTLARFTASAVDLTVCVPSFNYRVAQVDSSNNNVKEEE